MKISESKEVKHDGQVWGLLAGEWLRVWAAEPDCPGPNPGSATYSCMTGASTQPLWASVSPLTKKGSILLPGAVVSSGRVETPQKALAQGPGTSSGRDECPC